MKCNRIYIHEGDGHWIGSYVVAIAPNIATARKMIREKLDSMGLADKELSIEKRGSSAKTQCVLAVSGEY